MKQRQTSESILLGYLSTLIISKQIKLRWILSFSKGLEGGLAGNEEARESSPSF